MANSDRWMGGRPGRSRKVKGLWVGIQDEEIAETLRWLNGWPGKIRSIEKPAVNEAARRTLRRIVYDLSGVLNLERARIEESLTMDKYTANRRKAVIIGLGKNRPTLYEYDPDPDTPTHRGEAVSVMTRKDRGRRRVYGFVTAPTTGERAGTRNVYRRVGDDRLPIHILYGPRPMQIVRDELWGSIHAFAAQTLREQLLKQINLKLERA